MTRPITMAGLFALAAALAGCDLDLERMIDQPRYSTYEVCRVCPEGTIMMTPPAGTVPRQRVAGAPELISGRRGAGWVEEIPLQLDRAVLERGRNRFTIFCATCHGRLGNGVSQVAENMTLREPPSLVVPPVSDYPPGRTYAAIAQGYGLMRHYAEELPVTDRWAVVAYLEALEISQQAALEELPGPLQEEARRWLR